MISYLSNRHYLELNSILPPEFNRDQPTTLYYKTFIDQNTLNLLQKNKEVTHKTLLSSINKRFTVKKRKALNVEI